MISPAAKIMASTVSHGPWSQASTYEFDRMETIFHGASLLCIAQGANDDAAWFSYLSASAGYMARSKREIAA